MYWGIYKYTYIQFKTAAWQPRGKAFEWRKRPFWRLHWASYVGEIFLGWMVCFVVVSRMCFFPVLFVFFWVKLVFCFFYVAVFVFVILCFFFLRRVWMAKMAVLTTALRPAMLVCLCVCVRVCVFVFVFVSLCVYRCFSIAKTAVFNYRIEPAMLVCLCVRVCVCVCACVCTYIRICIFRKIQVALWLCFVTNWALIGY